MRKIITEILVLLWKAFRLVFWKWLKPLIAKFALYAVLVVGLVFLILTIMR